MMEIDQPIVATATRVKEARLVLEDGITFQGKQFGADRSIPGEVVFNTGMVGYPEAMTDPSYRGQILVLTYPLIGNYGIPIGETDPTRTPKRTFADIFESGEIQIRGLIISTLSTEYSHWSALSSLDAWMREHDIPGVSGVDTRALTKHLRTRGCMLGKIIVHDKDVAWEDPNKSNLVAEVSIKEIQHYPGKGKKNVVLVDLGCKTNIARRLVARGLDVKRVPWNYDWSKEQADGIVFSSGPGDPKMCSSVIPIIQEGFKRNTPMLGICLGHQLLALAAGADTYKMKFGHRSQNQPCIQTGTKRCYITSQNHGYAVDEKTLSAEWQSWFTNANDGTNEGMRHAAKPIFSVQFHPEAHPGPTDTDFIFDLFLQTINDAG